VLTTLSNIRTFTAEYGQEHTVPSVTATTIYKQCVYFTPELHVGGATVDNVATVELFDHTHVMNIADYYRNQSLANSFSTAVAGNDIIQDARMRILFRRASQVCQVRNQSNEPIMITCFYVKPRGKVRDAANITNLYTTLATGFANNGLDPGNILASTNNAMHTAYFSPYQSFDFVRHFKIYRVVKRRLQPSQVSAFKVTVRNKYIRPLDWIEALGTGNPSTWSGSQRLYKNMPPQALLLFKLTSNPAGFGGTAPQASYANFIQETTPTIVMDTLFRYETLSVPASMSTHGVIATSGIIDPTTAGHNPQVIVPDGDVIGDEKDAY
jgi:hypothetical protein